MDKVKRSKHPCLLANSGRVKWLALQALLQLLGPTGQIGTGGKVKSEVPACSWPAWLLPGTDESARAKFVLLQLKAIRPPLGTSRCCRPRLPSRPPKGLEKIVELSRMVPMGAERPREPSMTLRMEHFPCCTRVMNDLDGMVRWTVIHQT